MKRRRLLAAAAATTPFLAGCAGNGGYGGDSPTETTVTASPTPGAPSAQEAYPDYTWDQLEGVAATPTDTILMRNVAFHPLVSAVTPGTEVTVRNEDSTGHTFTAPKLGLDEALDGDTSVSFVVEETGTYDYVCTLHPPDMLGRLVVTEETPTPTGTPTASPTPTETPGEVGATVSATDADVFDPGRVQIEPGQAVRWVNTASGTYDDHTVTSARFHEKAEEWEMDEQFSGDERIHHTFGDAGVYEYYCSIHGKSTMCGAVLVGDVSLEKDLPCE